MARGGGCGEANLEVVRLCFRAFTPEANCPSFFQAKRRRPGSTSTCTSSPRDRLVSTRKSLSSSRHCTCTRVCVRAGCYIHTQTMKTNGGLAAAAAVMLVGSIQRVCVQRVMEGSPKRPPPFFHPDRRRVGVVQHLLSLPHGRLDTTNTIIETCLCCCYCLVLCCHYTTGWLDINGLPNSFLLRECINPDRERESSELI